jgi:WD40 repeat protein
MTCGADCSVKVWSVADMEAMLTFIGHSSPVMKMCKIGSSDTLATASEAGELAFWDLKLARELATSSQAHFGTA